LDKKHFHQLWLQRESLIETPIDVIYSVGQPYYTFSHKFYI